LTGPEGSRPHGTDLGRLGDDLTQGTARRGCGALVWHGVGWGLTGVDELVSPKRWETDVVVSARHWWGRHSGDSSPVKVVRWGDEDELGLDTRGVAMDERAVSKAELDGPVMASAQTPAVLHMDDDDW
jgi:hypothetical protein